MIETGTLPDHPHDGYALLRDQAVRLAGSPGDIAQRVMAHHQIYRDSGGNHAFPLVALHGAMWASGFFETTGQLGDALRARYFYSAKERNFRMAMLGGFAEGFKSVNRQVFIDTFTNYYFTKQYGSRREAEGILHPELYTALNAVHEARRAGESLNAAQKRQVFALALQFEQEVTVAPGFRTSPDIAGSGSGTLPTSRSGSPRRCCRSTSPPKPAGGLSKARCDAPRCCRPHTGRTSTST